MPSISVPTAIIGASVLGGATTAIASGNAASAQKQAANQANQTAQQFYGQSQQELQPYITGGQNAYGTLNQLLGVGSSGDPSQMQSALENLPGYQFTLNQGLKSTQNSAAARGLADSGAALKGAATYATGLANTNYGNYVNQLQNSANTGASAANALAGYGTQTAGNIGANTVGAGNASAAASNATGAGITNATNNSLGGYLYSLQNGLLNGNSGSSNSNPDYFFAGNSNSQNG